MVHNGRGNILELMICHSTCIIGRRDDSFMTIYFVFIVSGLSLQLRLSKGHGHKLAELYLSTALL